MEKKKKQKEKPDIMDAAARYVGTSMRTAWEVKQYLAKKEYPEDEIAGTVEQMISLGYIDDESYCRVFIEKSLAKGHGSGRIRSDLVSKRHVEPALADRVIEGMFLSDTERERAYETALKVLSDGEPDEKMQGRIGRRLSYYGFSADTIYWVLGRIRDLARDKER